MSVVSRRAVLGGLAAVSFSFSFDALAHRFSVALEDFGGGPHVNDNSGPWARMIDHCAKNNIRLLELGSGDYIFRSRPMPIPFSLNVVGVGSGMSRLVRAYQPEAQTDAFLHWTGKDGERGGGLRDLMLVMGDNTTGGRMIYLTGLDEFHRPHWMRFENIVVNGSIPSGNGQCWRTFDLDGMNIAVKGTQGIRDVSLLNSWMFRGVDACVRVANGTQFDMRGGGCSSRGEWRPRIVITGGDTVLTKSTNFRIDCYISGDVILENCTNGFVSGNIGGFLHIKSTAGQGKSVAFTGGGVTNEAADWQILGECDPRTESPCR